MSDLKAGLFVLLQRLLPKHLLTALLYRLARIRWPAFKDFLIRQFVRIFKVDVADVLEPIPDGFASFNDFFIRELNPGARPIAQSNDAIISPVDGTVSAAGRIDHNRVFQAKGLDYTLTDLLATDFAEAEHYVDGSFVTVYLAPYDYHRVHAPIDGNLVALRYVPGDLFSVNDSTVRKLPGLFARNERLVCHFNTGSVPMVFIFIGALNVGSITTNWTGEIRPKANGVVELIELRDTETGKRFDRGEQIGWFNFGSTIIMLLPPGCSDEFTGLGAGDHVRMGQAIGRMCSPGA